MDLSKVDATVESAIRDGVAPGACYAVNGRIRAFGQLTYGGEPVGETALWDLASLTKVVATTTLAMLLSQSGELDLDARVQAVLPLFRHDQVTFRHLLLHNSGLPASHPCPTRIGEGAELLRDMLTIELSHAPGTQTVYSDVGFVVLGRAIEEIGGAPLDRLFRRLVSEPLGLQDTTFKPSLGQASRCAPTEAIEPWRGRLHRERRLRPVNETWIQGEVHDPTAMVLGGVAGHAGLFSTIGDLASFMRGLLDGQIVSQETLRTFTRRASPASSRALGWDTPSEGSSAGSLLSERSFGHTGFTGTSIWCDPDRQLVAILLTNRVHPTADNEKIKAARIAFHDAVARA